ncbi:MAG: hypothetical protein ABIE74_01025 [Pseudomonadota bacterium]
MIKSSLDLHRKLPTPMLEPEEKIIKKCSGTLDIGQKAFSTFRPCNIYLTDRRLMLAQVRKVIKDFRYSTIKELTIVKRNWLAGKKKLQLKITLKSGHVHFVVMNEPQDWLRLMAEFGDMKVIRQVDDSEPLLLSEKFPGKKSVQKTQKKKGIKKSRRTKERAQKIKD